MNKTKFTHRTVFRFRRYCRRAYAVFNSLKREVTIGRLATYIADRQLHKSVALCAVALSLPLCEEAMAQSGDETGAVTLPEVRVVLSTDTLAGNPYPAAVLTANDFQNTSVRSVGELLALLPGLDLRSRGANDVQGDLSVNGGTFDQMVVLLNGINITDAQTGHHNLDMPIDISMVERVELLTPSQLMARGIVSFCGAVNIVVSDAYCDRLLAEVSGGSHGTAKASVLGTKTLGAWATTVAASYNRSDGYMRNTDYRHGSLFLQATRHSQQSDWRLQMGGQVKNFGSQAFYSTSYPDQYEATRTFTASASNVSRWGRVRLESDLYTRLHSDRFELFRQDYAEPPEWYSGHNRHLSDVSGLRSRMLYQMGNSALSAGAELRHEGIVSNVLGESLSEPWHLFGNEYPKSASRLAASAFAGYHFAKNGWQAAANVLAMHSSVFGFNWGFSADAAYKFSRTTRLRAALARTYRMPSFTDLYYQSVNQVANPDLNGEKAWSGELELRYSGHKATASAMVFYRSGTDIIDWVRNPDEEVWYSMNHTSVDAFGADFAANYTPRGFVHALGCGYSYCGIAQDAGEMISGSVLDYLRHKALAYIVFAPTEKLRLKIDATYRYRQGHYVADDGKVCDYGGVMLLNAKLEYCIKTVTLFAEGHNLANSSYRDHGGVPQPGIMFFAGARVGLGNK